MSELTVYTADDPDTRLAHVTDGEEIMRVLGEAGVRFERWSTPLDITPAMQPDEILAAYADDIARLKRQGGYSTADVVSMFPDHPDKQALREKFLSEHTHAEDEVRFFVDGEGLFSLHLGDRVFCLRCCKDDLLSVPADTPHWFDMGNAPRFTAIRLFTNPEGWVAHYTGSPIADRFPRF
jgi:1,2-dihydroxy-3-keto-5-methylthiopentene dioxygenase